MANKEIITFGQTLKNLRLSKSLTQKQVANLVGMERRYYSKLEANKLNGVAKLYCSQPARIDAFSKALKLGFVEEMALYNSANRVHPMLLEVVLRMQKNILDSTPKGINVTHDKFGVSLSSY